MAHLVVEYLEETAARFPDKVAFIDDERVVSFGGLRCEALKIAHRLQSIMGGELQFPVLVYLEKSISAIAAFLGTAYAGGFYSPVDTKMPTGRIKKIVQTLQPCIILTDRVHFQEAKAFADSAVVIAQEDVLADDVPLADKDVRNILWRLTDTDVLYVLFTSGSTGTPKGVIINHRAVVDFIEWISQNYHFDETTVFANQAQLYFDLSIQDVYAPLRNGATTVLIPNRTYVQPLRVWKKIMAYHVNTLVWIPSMLCQFANYDILSHVDHASLKTVLFCGEVMPIKQLNVWRDMYPETVFGNLYGPTECTEACTYYTIDRDFSDDEVLPIGRACENCEAIVLDRQGRRILKTNEIGELCIRGTCLSMGYYGDPERTADSFVQNPLQKNYPETIYRTGDLVKYNTYGELVYVSRKDFQIKHRGYRVELGEIDVAATAVDGVDYSCCLFDAERDRLLLVYTGNASVQAVRKALEQRLQAYMMPSEIHKRATMLFNMNGKIDRKLLTLEYCGGADGRKH